MKKYFGWILTMSVILGIFNGVYAEELVDGVISENSTELETAIPQFPRELWNTVVKLKLCSQKT